MTKLPCINCITLPICKSNLELNYKLLLQIRDYRNMVTYANTKLTGFNEWEWLLGWIVNLMIRPILAKCSIASEYMTNHEKETELDPKRITALFSYLHLKGYLEYSQIKRYLEYSRTQQKQRTIKGRL